MRRGIFNPAASKARLLSLPYEVPAISPDSPMLIVWHLRIDTDVLAPLVRPCGAIDGEEGTTIEDSDGRWILRVGGVAGGSEGREADRIRVISAITADEGRDIPDSTLS